MAKVKPVNAHVFALLRSTRPSEFDGATLILEVFFRFHKEKFEEPKIMDLLCESLSAVLGKKVRFKFTLAERGSKLPSAVRASNVSEIDSSELSKIAQEIFSK